MKNPRKTCIGRIANEVARVESKYPNALTAKELYDLLDHFKYIVPQGSPMTESVTTIRLPSLLTSSGVALKSNCFVIGVDGAADSYGSIIKSTKNRCN
jgi:ribonucleoside-diphosphate reductase alpha chain